MMKKSRNVKKHETVYKSSSDPKMVSLNKALNVVQLFRQIKRNSPKTLQKHFDSLTDILQSYPSNAIKPSFSLSLNLSCEQTHLGKTRAIRSRCISSRASSSSSNREQFNSRRAFRRKSGWKKFARRRGKREPNYYRFLRLRVRALRRGKKKWDAISVASLFREGRRGNRKETLIAFSLSCYFSRSLSLPFGLRVYIRKSKRERERKKEGAAAAGSHTVNYCFGRRCI